MISLASCMTLSDTFASEVPLLASRSSAATRDLSHGPVKWLGPWISAEASIIFGAARPLGHEILRDE